MTTAPRSSEAGELPPVVFPGAGYGATFVLVHGAYHGGWCWRRTADRLRNAKHRVFTPTFTGLGDRSHLLTRETGLQTAIQDVIDLITTEDLDEVVLVAHSFGGIPATAVADRLKHRIKQLVFLDAAFLPSGTRVFDLFAPDIVSARRKLARSSSGGMTVPAPLPNVFGVSDPADAAWMAGHLRPMPIRMYEEQLILQHPLGNGLPVTYVACVNPVYTDVAPFHAFARNQLDWTYVELSSAHDAMVVAPDALTEILLGTVRYAEVQTPWGSTSGE